MRGNHSNYHSAMIYAVATALFVAFAGAAALIDAPAALVNLLTGLATVPLTAGVLDQFIEHRRRRQWEPSRQTVLRLLADSICATLYSFNATPATSAVLLSDDREGRTLRQRLDSAIEMLSGDFAVFEQDRFIVRALRMGYDHLLVSFSGLLALPVSRDQELEAALGKALAQFSRSIRTLEMESAGDAALDELRETVKRIAGASSKDIAHGALAELRRVAILVAAKIET